MKRSVVGSIYKVVKINSWVNNKDIDHSCAIVFVCACNYLVQFGFLSIGERDRIESKLALELKMSKYCLIRLTYLESLCVSMKQTAAMVRRQHQIEEEIIEVS
jgi:hypothetical protein